MRAHELGVPINEAPQWIDRDLHDLRLRDRLERLGYVEVGSGAEASVWARDAGSVVKIIMPRDDGTINTGGWRTFMRFYRFCTSHPQLDCLPRFMPLKSRSGGEGGKSHGRITIGGIPHLQIAMERLQPLEQNSARTAVVWRLSDWASEGLTWADVHDRLRDGEAWRSWDEDVGVTVDEIINWVDEWDRVDALNWAVFYNTMRLLYHHGRINRVGWDAHTENVMLRGTTPVITDPWFNMKIDEL